MNDDIIDEGERLGDVEAVIQLTYNIFDYIPELMFVSVYALVMYAAIRWISRTIKKD
jgi:hypothetical protein